MGCCGGKLPAQINDKFQGRRIIAKDMRGPFLPYQRSQTYVPSLGAGALVLSSDILWFGLHYLNHQIEIDLSNIRVVEVEEP